MRQEDVLSVYGSDVANPSAALEAHIAGLLRAAIKGPFAMLSKYYIMDNFTVLPNVAAFSNGSLQAFLLAKSRLYTLWSKCSSAQSW